MTNTLRRAVFEAVLATGDMVKVLLVKTHPDQLLPADLKYPLTLHYGLVMPVSIPDLDSGPDGIRATLSFDRTPVRTFVPWETVEAIQVDGVLVCVFSADAAVVVPAAVFKPESSPPSSAPAPKLGLVP